MSRSLAALGALTAIAFGCGDPGQALAATGASPASVVIAFLPTEPTPAPAGLTVSPDSASAASAKQSADDRARAAMASVPSLAIGLLSATQGPYDPTQTLLDLTQGTRVSRSVYTPQASPVTLPATGTSNVAIPGWSGVLRRAASAPQTIEPGLLASSVPGGVGYVSNAPQATLDDLVATDRLGRIASVSLGPANSLASRVQGVQRSRRLVVVDLSGGSAGVSQLRALAAGRPAGELLIALEQPPPRGGHELLWTGIAGLGPGRELTSDSTTLPGVVAGIDIAPSVLAHLRLARPSAMRGQPIATHGSLDLAALNSFKARLSAIDGRRIPVLEVVLLAWLLAFLAAGAVGGPARSRQVLRVGGVGLLWAPVAVIVTASLDPSRGPEELLVIALCLVGGVLSDRLAPWPRAPLLPAIAGLATIALDAGLGWHLLVRSLLGPNPSFGARFYGIGNELKSGLAVLTFAGVAAALSPSRRSSRAAGAFIAAGAVLGVVLGSARLGAGVGGAMLVAAGTAVAAVMILPGRSTRVRVIAIALSPLLALIVLAIVDLSTAGGRGHYVHNVLEAGSPGTFEDIVVRRYGLALRAVITGAMPLAAVTALLAAAYALRNRIYAGLGDPAWYAALGGGFAAGVTGSLSEDSGPLLLVVATFTLAILTAYLCNPPPGAGDGRAARARSPV